MPSPSQPPRTSLLKLGGNGASSPPKAHPLHHAEPPPLVVTIGEEAASPSEITANVSAAEVIASVASVPPIKAQGMLILETLIRQADAEDISDIHIRTDRFTYAKARGGHAPVVDWGRMPSALVLEIVGILYENRYQVTGSWSREGSSRSLEECLKQDRVANFACEGGPLAGTLSCGRLRVQVYLCSSGIGATIRVLKEKIMTMEDVGLPKDVVERLRAFVMKKSGLGLVTGPTGSGKSTTLASLIEWVRTNSTRNIVTIEDPIEYTYPDTAQSPDGPEGSEVPSPSIITQQEVGMHIGSFAQGLRDALRKNPDIILIGEIRDTETMQTCVEAAQTGHLILSTLHTRGAAKTLTRVAGLFPAEKAKGEIENLAECLLFILSQGLIPGERDGKKLVCCEFLQNTDTATRSAISKYGAGETSALDDLLGRAGNTEWDNQLKALLDDRQISDESYREFRKKGPEEVS